MSSVADTIHTVLASLTFVIIVVLATDAAIGKYTALNAPVALRGVKFEVQEAEPNSYVWLNVSRTLRKPCPAQVFQFWKHTKTGTVIQDGVRPADPSNEVGTTTIRFRKKVPDVKPENYGEWCYIPQLLYFCGIDTHVITPPPACLVISSTAGDS